MHEGDRQPGPPRRRGRPLRHRRRARHRARQAEDLKLFLSVAKPDGSCRCTASTATSSPTPGCAKIMGVHRDHIVVAEDGDRLVLDDDGLRPAGRVPAEYIYVHGTVGDIGTRTCCGDRRILGDEGVVAAIVVRRLAARAARRRARDRHPGLGPRDGVGGPRRGGRPSGSARTVRRAVASGDKAEASQLENGRPARRRGRSSTTRPAAGR